MVSFDRLFFSVTLRKTTVNRNSERFTFNPKTNEYRYNSMGSKRRGNNKLVITIKGHDMTFDFTSKILNERMIELINKDNIRDCLNNIKARNIINFDVDYVLHNADVIAADVTKDIEVDASWIDQLSYYTSVHVKNSRKYTIDHYGDRLILRKLSGVSDKRYRRSMAVYDKYYELKRNHCSSQNVLEHYRGVWRIERKLQTKKEIREALHLVSSKHISLLEVLNAEANPLTELYTQMVDIEPHSIIYTDVKTHRIGLLVEHCQWNIKKIEEVLRRTHKSFYRKMLIPYQDFIDNHNDYTATQLVKQITDFFDTSDCSP